MVPLRDSVEANEQSRPLSLPSFMSDARTLPVSVHKSTSGVTHNSIWMHIIRGKLAASHFAGKAGHDHALGIRADRARGNERFPIARPVINSSYRETDAYPKQREPLFRFGYSDQ